ncbi:TraB/GumN family protein [Pseudoduganella sp. FT25W]|uniref:TraB/GumN family protein n=1 Tax=Duganella alba TaxID=2666081 RepID=A0A6L5QBA9_9BURK|nr:TraB/GumN family protein [Duganella alba]MRX16154.1 TraB/GumN family protein [Duganella alba]
MRRQIIVLFCSLFFFAFGPAVAEQQGAAPNRGALFKVQQGGHTLYLFGTIHVGARDFYPLEPRLAGLLKNAPALALEIDPLGDPQALARAVQQHGLAAKGAPALAPAWRQRLDRLLQQYNIEPQTVAAMKPWLLASLLTVSEFAAQGYEASLAVDAHLSKQAHDAGQKIVELESADSQMALFDQMSAAEQLVFLQEAIEGIEDKEQAYQAREIADAWRHADVKALEALALKAEQDQTFSGRFVQKVLLEGRNPALADGMVKLMARENNSVAAIGVLHLIGKTSVPELLRKRGLTVERIY